MITETHVPQMAENQYEDKSCKAKSMQQSLRASQKYPSGWNVWLESELLFSHLCLLLHVYGGT